MVLLDTMEEWDQETLEKVVESKKAEYNQNKPTEIVCLLTNFYPFTCLLSRCIVVLGVLIFESVVLSHFCTCLLLLS